MRLDQASSSAFGRDMQNPLHVNSRYVDVARRQGLVRDMGRFDDGDFRPHGHAGAEILLRPAKGYIAPAVGPVGADKGEIRSQRRFQNVLPTVEFTDFLAFSQFCAQPRRRLDRREPGAGGAHAFGEGSLWHQLQFQRTVLKLTFRRRRFPPPAARG